MKNYTPHIMKHVLASIFTFCFFIAVFAQNNHPLEGRWDLELQLDGKTYPSWLEVTKSGVSTFVGRYVSISGSARPISEIKMDGNSFTFKIPPQWWVDQGALIVNGNIDNKKLTGEVKFEKGSTYSFIGNPAPTFAYKDKVEFEVGKMLFNGHDLTGWTLDGEKPWMVENGILKGPGGASNLISEEKFNDFRLSVEFRIPEGSNSGIYLRGRYEVQIQDDYGKQPSNILFGGIYGFLTPNQMAAKKAGEWQSYEITLIGNRVTVVANGKAIITDHTIPGITGGAIDSAEGMPGPIMLQGDHGPVEFRRVLIMPIK